MPAGDVSLTMTLPAGSLPLVLVDQQPPGDVRTATSGTRKGAAAGLTPAAAGARLPQGESGTMPAGAEGTVS